MRGHGGSPYLTADEEAELYLLRRHLQVWPSEALTRPAWEVDLLSRGLARELDPPEPVAPPRAKRPDPYAEVPPSLRGL